MKTRQVLLALVSVCVLSSGSLVACAKAKLINANLTLPNINGITLPGNTSSTQEILAKPVAGFVISSGGQISTGTGMTVVATLGEPYGTLGTDSPIQSGTGIKVVPGIKASLIRH